MVKNTTKIICIIQARVNSTRLPNKILKEIEGIPLISHVIERIKTVKTIQQIILATTTNTNDKILSEISKKHNINFFSGDEDDVLNRFFQAATKFHGNPIIRITGDCPLIDPTLISQIIEFFQKHDFDYVSNTIDRTFPDGLDVEIFSYDLLKEIHEKSKWSSEREHVTPFVAKNPHRFKIYHYKTKHDFSHLRWCVDEENDLLLIRKIFDKMKPNKFFTMNEVLQLILKNTALSEINCSTTTNEGYKKSLDNDRIITKK
jgi:spore coat polysaccharide biosynthesis protein SpsF